MLVAEIGLNHMGSACVLNRYLDLSDYFDGVTVQVLCDSFYRDQKYSSFYLEDKYLKEFLIQQKKQGKKIGVAIDDITKIKQYDAIGVSFYKVLSKDVNDFELISELTKTAADSIYVSTGMSGDQELDKIVCNLKLKDSRIKLIHTQLSNEIADVNLRAIKSMRDKYEMLIAYGHHCKSPEVLYTSLGFDPEAIFIYVKDSDYMLDYPDDIHAFCIDELPNVCNTINDVRISIGSGKKETMENWA